MTYTLPQDLIQAIVNTLATMPAAQTRALLNAIEATCVQQDQERAEQAKAADLAKAKEAWAKEQQEAAEKAEAAAQAVKDAEQAAKDAVTRAEALPEPTAT